MSDQLPRDPAQYRPRPLMGAGFFAIIAFGVLCVLAGVGVAYLGPRLLPPKPQVPAPAPAALTPAPAPMPAAPPAAAPPATSSAAEIEALRARVAMLESQGARSVEAAAAAVAAAGVIDASRTSRPFAAEVAALRQAAPDLPELASLSRLAATGAPSRAALASSFTDFAARAAVKARKPDAQSGVADRLAYLAAGLVQVRRIDDLESNAPDAMLARAEAALAEGDVVAALRQIDGLPPAARHALEPWRIGAERRAEIDRQVSALRARALQDLNLPDTGKAGAAA